MKLISHKGNIDGPDPSKENTPDQIEYCVKNGYDVEIDVWFVDGKLWLGHDTPQYEVTWLWLSGLRSFLWIHCKDFKTLTKFVDNASGYNYFFHRQDDYTLTSKHFIWAYPGKMYGNNTVINVVGEPGESLGECYGICSDYVGRMR